MLEDLKESLTLKNELIIKTISEFVGTTVYTIMFSASRAQFVLGGDTDYDTLQLTRGIAYMMALYATGRSGEAQCNSVFTFILTVTGHLRFTEMICFILAQLLAGYCGTWMVYTIYKEAINKYDGGTRQSYDTDKSTGFVFVSLSYDTSEVEPNVLLDYTLSYAIMTAIVLAEMFHRSSALSGLSNSSGGETRPLVLGLTMVLVGFAFGYSYNCPENPAVELGARLAMTPYWGSLAFLGDEILIILSASYLGGIVGWGSYSIFVGNHRQSQFEEAISGWFNSFTDWFFGFFEKCC